MFVRRGGILVASTTAIAMLTSVAAAGEPSANQATDTPVQGYGRHDKTCLEWTDACVRCLRAQSGGDYSCSNIGIACQPEKIVRCVKRAVETKQ
jgi:hypothetical protein